MSYIGVNDTDQIATITQGRGFGAMRGVTKSRNSILTKISQSEVTWGAITSTYVQFQSNPDSFLSQQSRFSFTVNRGNVPDVVDECFLELVIFNPSIGGSVNFEAYSAAIAKTIQFQFASEQLSWDGTVNALHSLMLYNQEQLNIRAGYENIDPTTGAPAVTTINGGDRIVLQIPLWCIPIVRRRHYIRLFDGQQLIFTLINYGKTDIFTNVVAPSTAAGMVIESVTLRFKGYNFADDTNDTIMQAFKSGAVLETRDYDMQLVNYPVPGNAIAAGIPQTILLNGLSALCPGVTFFIRSNTVTPQNALLPIVDGIETVEFLNGSTLLQFYPSQFSTKTLRDIIVWQDASFGEGSVGNSSCSNLQITTYPVSSNILHVLNKETVQGLYQFNNSIQIKYTPGATQANVQLYFVYLRDTNVISSYQDPFTFKQL